MLIVFFRIRPLQRSDRRFLRVSGRHQVSADGRHLIDGVAFGRPFLKRPDRPPVRIPSVKRPRLSDNHNNLNEGNGINQLVLRENNELELDNGFDDAEYEEPDVITSETVRHAMASQGSLRLTDGTRQSQRLSNSRKRRRAGLGIGIEADISHGETPPVTNHLTVHRGGASGSASPGRISSRSSAKSVRFNGDELETPATILAPEESEDSDDDEDFDPEDQSSESSESNKENIKPESPARRDIKNGPLKSNKEANSAAQYDMLSSSGDSDSDSSDFDTDSDVESGVSVSSSDSNASISSLSSSSSISSSSESSSGSSSDSSDLSSSEDELAPVSPSAKKKSSVALLATGTPSTRIPPVETPLFNSQSAPGEGLSATKKRNQRRRQREKASKLAKRAVVSNLSAESPAVSEPNRGSNLEGDTVLDDQDKVDDSLLEAKKVSLLHALGSKQEEKTLEESPGNVLSKVEPTSLAKPDAKTDRDQVTSQEEVHNENQPRRSRLDTASTRRLIFGSLGLRTPKTKKDEDALREKLSADVRVPTKAPQREDINEVNEQPVENAESWQAKVALAAVECYEEDVDLSTPPFPFVQRWDPQQQTKSKKKRGSGANKRLKRKDSQYYQQSNDYDYEVDESNVQVESQNISYVSFSGYDEALERTQTTLDEGLHKVTRSNSPQSTSSSIQAAVNEQIIQDTNHYSNTTEPSQEQDLPSLPADLSRCKVLSLPLARPNAIIAFKQLEMSARTKWCPVTSEYRTAKIEKVLDNADLQLTLAARDVTPKQKLYDPVTGARVYGRFECPSDEEGASDDDGRHLEISILDMVDPKIIQEAENVDTGNSIQDVPLNEGIDVNLATKPNVEASLAKSEAEGADKSFKGYLEAASTQGTIARGVTGYGILDQATGEMPESARKEYSLLMKEAGFRSDLADGMQPAFEDKTRKPASQKSSSATQDAANHSESFLGGGQENDDSQFVSLLDSGQTGQDSSYRPSAPTTDVEAEKEGMDVDSLENEHGIQSSSFAVPDTADADESNARESLPFDSSYEDYTADPDLFPILNKEVDDDSEAYSSKVPPESPVVDESRNEALHSSSSLPSPNFFKSQPLPKPSRLSKEDQIWDAEYLPSGSTAPTAEQGQRKPATRGSSGMLIATLGNGNTDAKAKKSSKRRNIFDLPTSSDKDVKQEPEPARNLSLDGAAEEITSPPSDHSDNSHLKKYAAHNAASIRSNNLFVPRSIQSMVPKRMRQKDPSPASGLPSTASSAASASNVDLKMETDRDEINKKAALPQGTGWIQKSESTKNSSGKKNRKRAKGEKVRTRSVV